MILFLSIINFSKGGIYRNNLKNRFLSASALTQIFRLHFSPCLWQCPLAPVKKFEEPPWHNLDSSDYFGIIGCINNYLGWKFKIQRARNALSEMEFVIGGCHRGWRLGCRDKSLGRIWRGSSPHFLHFAPWLRLNRGRDRLRALFQIH